MKCFAVVVAALALCCVSACSIFKRDIYPENPYTGSIEIKSVAVAPFIVADDIAMQPSPQFGLGMFKAGDGRTICYSTEFAATFASNLSQFGLTIYPPHKVEAAWIEAEKNGQPSNPMATKDQAMALGRMLKVDAILVGEVMTWKPYDETVLRLHWSLFYTRSRATSAGDVREAERSGLGGGEAGMDYSKMPVFSEQLVLDSGTKKTIEDLETYTSSLGDIDPYHNKTKAITARSYPYYVEFASWVAMRNAFIDWEANSKSGR
ncbi:MAG: hypothetical protein L6Q71_10105 [Planctomycetes bacterium]|nr:hypothetical protein [Planctomycetota bacterium]NUQ33779.1 hypothetical protein [Planctomycetaceae bacterium]